MSINKELIAVILPDGRLHLEWRTVDEILSKDTIRLQEEIYRRFQNSLDDALFFLAFVKKDIPLSDSLNFFRDFTQLFSKRLSRTEDIEILRHMAHIPVHHGELDSVIENAPMSAGFEYLTKDLLIDIWDLLLARFRNEIRQYPSTVADFIKSYSPDVHLVGRVFFHLVEHKKASLPFAFLATYSTGLDKMNRSQHLPLKHALTELAGKEEKLLELLCTVISASKESEFVSKLLETGEIFQPIGLTVNEAYVFLKEVPIYEKNGILCRLPNWFKGLKASSVSMRLGVGNTSSGGAGLDALLDFKVSLYIQDEEVSVDELRKLIELEEGLAFIKNKWVVVDHERLREILDAYDKTTNLLTNMDLTFSQALRLQLNPQKYLKINDTEGIEISSGDYLKSVIERLCNVEGLPEIKPPQDVTEILRHYQKSGIKWLYNMYHLRFGCCLADDMGLGKTLQVLALLRILKGLGVNLLVVPVSLISNWEDEIKKFAPDLNYFIAHPAFNNKKQVELPDNNFINGIDLVISTYGLLQKYEWIKKCKWHYIILDEAQAIKNPETKQTKAVKRLNSSNKIAITGTPIENNLYDLWSIFDFLNPGLLGSFSEFNDFCRNMRNSSDGFKRIRKVVTPFILRRLKSDKSIINDLPDKIEMKTYATLSKKQALLYQQAVERLKNEIKDSEGIQRKGLVLTYLMKFKQLCNHPDHYTGRGDYEEADSGKFERLREICDAIAQRREKLIIFTQFREITKPLQRFLIDVFGKRGNILDGSIPASQRKKIVDEFQSAADIAFMVLSIKAGGVGLNLTSANHVIIFDRWWNPAVENQAVDRAFRIGQKKNVVVHKFLTKGTIEEKIDSIIESKKQIFNDVIVKTSDESWITEMSNEELIKMFSLSIN